MSNEIKQGDKVRVSKDAPTLCVVYGMTNWKAVVSTVETIDGDVACIKHLNEDIDTLEHIVIPTKYLVKVDAEAKEPKYKVGDKVVFIPTGKVKVVSRINANSQYAITEPNGQSPLCVRETELAPYIEPNAPKFKVGDRVRNVKSDLCGIALNIEHGIVEVGIPYDKEKHYWNTDIVELFEPAEQTEAEKTDSDNFKKTAEEWANTVSKAIKEYGDAACKIIIDAHNEAYWDAYAAELAKGLVTILVRTRSNDLNKVAKMSVDIAKAVVDGLKRK